MRELNAEMKKFYRCCDNMIKANSIRQQLPLKYEIREVTGTHMKACSGCGKTSWTSDF